MSTVATLAVNLTMKTAGFMTGANATKKKLGKLRFAANKAAKRFLKLGVAAAAAGVAMGTYFVKQSFDTLDVLAKLAERVEASANWIQGMRHAAQLAGGTIEQMDKALEMFNRRLGEANMGMGEARPALEALGLSAKELSEVGVEEAMYRTVEAISKITSVTERAVLAYQIFGRQGQRLLNMMLGGRRDIESAVAESIALRGQLTADGLRRVQEANDAMVRAKLALAGLSDLIAIVLAPIVEDIATWFVQMGKTGTLSLDSLKAAARDLIPVLVTVGNVATTLGSIWDFTKGAVSTVGAALTKPLAMAGEAADWIAGGPTKTNQTVIEFHKQLARQADKSFVDAFNPNYLDADKMRSQFDAGQNRKPLAAPKKTGELSELEKQTLLMRKLVEDGKRLQGLAQ